MERPKIDLNDYMKRNRTEKEEVADAIANEPEPEISSYASGSDAASMLSKFTTHHLSVETSGSTGVYQGTVFAVVKVDASEEDHIDDDTLWAIWRENFRSCGGCDAYMDEPIEVKKDLIEKTLQEGNVRVFYSLEDADQYLEECDEYFWNKFPPTLIEEAMEDE